LRVLSFSGFYCTKPLSHFTLAASHSIRNKLGRKMAQFRRTERTETTLSVVAVQVPWSLTQLCLRSLALNQSINQFISRHSTEARATVRLWRIKDKCLKMDLKCVSWWSSSTVQWKRVPESLSDRLLLSYVGLCWKFETFWYFSSHQLLRRPLHWEMQSLSWPVWMTAVHSVAIVLHRYVFTIQRRHVLVLERASALRRYFETRDDQYYT